MILSLTGSQLMIDFSVILSNISPTPFSCSTPPEYSIVTSSDTGVRQGCILSPLLFDWVMKKSLTNFQGELEWMDGNQLCDLDYADDIALNETSQMGRQKPVMIHFIDFRKAFDCLHRPSMWSILRQYGIPESIVTIIQNLYKGSRSCVKLNGVCSDCLDETKRVMYSVSNLQSLQSSFSLCQPLH